MTRLKITLIALILFLISFEQGMAFGDVPSSHKNFVAIEELTDRGMIEGYAGNVFKPEKTIRRAEAAKLIVLATKEYAFYDYDFDLESSNPFYDVPLSKWYAPYVQVAKANYIVNGYPNGSFQPKKMINFAEGLKMILEAYEVNLSDYPYRDRLLVHMDFDDWYASYFNYAYERNLINRNKYYHPKHEMTRGDFAEILYRLEILSETGNEVFQSNQVSSSNDYKITIPRLGIIDLNVSFADIYDSNQALDILKYGLGHYLSPPGSGQKMILFGHSSGYSWDNSPFKQVLLYINQMQPGDRIFVNYREKGYAYEMTHYEIIPAQNLSKIVDDEDNGQLALYTCWPPNSIAKRYVVYAQPLN